MKRAMVRRRTRRGRLVACTACSWWIPMIGTRLSISRKQFDKHICSDHQSPKTIEKTSGLE
jgi:hypothetical protein